MEPDRNAGRLAGLLGLARRAGKLTTGFDAVMESVALGKAVLIMTAADLSEKTEKELRFANEGKAVSIQKLPLDKEELRHALGLFKPVGVLALEDKGFAASVLKLYPLSRHDFEEENTL